MRYFRNLSLNKWLLLAMLVLPVGLSSLSLAHAMEGDHDVHEQHQCDIYDAIQNALSNSVDVEPSLDKAQCFRTFYTLQATLYSQSLPRTRAPPQTV